MLIKSRLSCRVYGNAARLILLKNLVVCITTMWCIVTLTKGKVLDNIFEVDLNPRRIIKDLSLLHGKDIKPTATLIIFDEIQSCGKVLASLKYFCEDAPEYHIIAAGSLLGVATSKGTSFPVGKVEFLTLYPMNFYEFLNAQNHVLAKTLKDASFDDPI